MEFDIVQDLNTKGNRNQDLQNNSVKYSTMMGNIILCQECLIKFCTVWRGLKFETQNDSTPRKFRFEKTRTKIFSPEFFQAFPGSLANCCDSKKFHSANLICLQETSTITSWKGDRSDRNRIVPLEAALNSSTFLGKATRPTLSFPPTNSVSIERLGSGESKLNEWPFPAINVPRRSDVPGQAVECLRGMPWHAKVDRVTGALGRHTVDILDTYRSTSKYQTCLSSGIVLAWSFRPAYLTFQDDWLWIFDTSFRLDAQIRSPMSHQFFQTTAFALFVS